MAKDKQVEAKTHRHVAVFQLPFDHKPGMRVPKGGSNCAKCEYLADNKTDCTNKDFQAWNGGPRIPGKIDEYCSDWFGTKEKK